MAKITRPLTLRYQTTVDGDIGTTELRVGDEVTVVHRWPRLVLIKDGEGHFYNVPEDAVEAAAA